MASAINLDDTATINAERLTDIHGMITRAQRVRGAGVLARPASPSPASTRTGRRSAAACRNYLAVRRVPRGRRARHRQAVLPARHHPRQGPHRRSMPYDHKQVAGVHHQLVVRVLRRATTAGLHPCEGRDQGRSTPARKPPWTYLQGETKYTWMKAPRYDGRPMRGRARWRACSSPTRRATRTCGSMVERGARPARGRARRRSSRPSAAPRRAAWRRCCSPADGACGTTSWSTGSRAATPRPSTSDKWEPSTWPAKAPGLRLPRRAARRAGPLGADRERQDLALPVRGAEHLELLAARRARGSRARTRRR